MKKMSVVLDRYEENYFNYVFDGGACDAFLARQRQRQPFNLWYTIVYIFNKNTMKID